MSPRRIAKVLGLIGGVAIGAIVIVTVWVVRHRTTEQTLVSAAGLLPTALLHARNFHWTQMKGGESQWVLTAKDASYSADKTTIALTDARVAMIAKDGKQTSLAAPTASLSLDGNHVNRAQLNGGVVVHYGDYVLTTDRAVFKPDEDRIDAPGAVKIEGQGLTVTGTGMTGHPKAEIFELLKEVSTQIVPANQAGAAKVS